MHKLYFCFIWFKVPRLTVGSKTPHILICVVTNQKKALMKLKRSSVDPSEYKGIHH